MKTFPPPTYGFLTSLTTKFPVTSFSSLLFGALRYRESKWLPQGHTRSLSQSQELIQISRASVQCRHHETCLPLSASSFSPCSKAWGLNSTLSSGCQCHSSAGHEKSLQPTVVPGTHSFLNSLMAPFANWLPFSPNFFVKKRITGENCLRKNCFRANMSVVYKESLWFHCGTT